MTPSLTHQHAGLATALLKTSLSGSGSGAPGYGAVGIRGTACHPARVPPSKRCRRVVTMFRERMQESERAGLDQGQGTQVPTFSVIDLLQVHVILNTARRRRRQRGQAMQDGSVVVCWHRGPVGERRPRRLDRIIDVRPAGRGDCGQRGAVRRVEDFHRLSAPGTSPVPADQE